MHLLRFATLGLLLGPAACAGPNAPVASEETLIQAYLDERVTEYRRIRQEICRQSVLEESMRRADSIIALQARLAKDTLLRPPIPVKPTKPEILHPKDTLAVKPFLNNKE